MPMVITTGYSQCKVEGRQLPLPRHKVARAKPARLLYRSRIRFLVSPLSLRKRAEIPSRSGFSNSPRRNDRSVQRTVFYSSIIMRQSTDLILELEKCTVPTVSTRLLLLSDMTEGENTWCAHNAD